MAASGGDGLARIIKWVGIHGRNMVHCPNCGTEISQSQNFCRECGEDLSKHRGIFDGDDSEDDSGRSFRNRVNDVRDTISGSKQSQSKHLDCTPQGDWVTVKRLQKVDDLLDDDETVHYMWRGGTIDVEGSSAGDSIFGNDRDRKSSLKGIFTAVTNKRVVIAIPQFLGDDERHVPYHSITSVDLDTGLINKRVSLQTKGQTYHIQAQGPSKDELRDAMRFIREKIEETNRPQPVQTEDESDPTEQLRNLKELHDEGVLTDEEFESKKQALLDEI